MGSIGECLIKTFYMATRREEGRKFFSPLASHRAFRFSDLHMLSVGSDLVWDMINFKLYKHKISKIKNPNNNFFMGNT